MKIEKIKIEQIQELCKSNKVKTLFAFGSVLRDDFSENSDIDLVVDIDEKDPFKYTDIYFNLKSKLEDLKILGNGLRLKGSRNLPQNLLEKRFM